MKRQVAKISDGLAQYKVVFDDQIETNPYKICMYWTEKSDEWPGWKQKQKQVMRCADLSSCLYYLGGDVQYRFGRLIGNEAVAETFKRR